MTLKGDSYTVEYVKINNLIVFRGVLRFQGREHYQQIFDLLVNSISDVESVLAIDMSKLEFLNSSGISSLCLFAIHLRDVPGKRVVITGSNSISWQAKSLSNLLKFTNKIQLTLI